MIKILSGEFICFEAKQLKRNTSQEQNSDEIKFKLSKIIYLERVSESELAMGFSLFAK